MTPGDLSMTPQDLSKTPGDLSMTPQDLSKTAGDLSKNPGDLSNFRTTSLHAFKTILSYYFEDKPKLMY
jgi:hypothetical protein